MNILALTDIHGSYDTAERIISRVSPDILIVGGDLTTIGTMREARDAVLRFQSAVSTVLCIAGNMDLPEHDELFVKMGVSLNGRGVKIGNVGFCGASGAPVSRLKTPNEITEEELARRFRSGYDDVRGAALVILVPHAPPFGTRLDLVHAGYHAGSSAVRDAIEEYAPDAVICGHIHESRGQDQIDRTPIVNCGPAFEGSYAVLRVAEGIQIESCRLTD